MEEALAQPNPDPFDTGFKCALAGVGLEGHKEQCGHLCGTRAARVFLRISKSEVTCLTLSNVSL